MFKSHGKVIPIMITMTIEQLSDMYQTNPVIRALVQLIPIVSIVDAALVTKIEKIHTKKARVFFDELENGTVQLTQEMIESEDFLHCYFSTFKAALNSHRREKICYFARLLTSSITLSEISTIDEYEEYLSILDDLSFRELKLLIVLSRYEKEFFLQGDKNPLQRANRFWEQFSLEVCSKFSISDGELDGMLARLNRTGLYKTIIGTYVGYNGGRGELTPMYAKLEEMIRLEEMEF